MVGKDQSGMIDKATESIAPQLQALPLKERLEVPDRLTYAYEKGNLKIEADAKIVVPDGELPILRVFPKDFEQQTVNDLWNVLIGDRVMYETDFQTRGDLEKMIDYYNRVISGELTQDQVMTTPEEAEEKLNELKQQYLSAPEDGERPIADGTLHVAYLDSETEQNAAKRTVLNAYNFDERISFSVNNNYDNTERVITRTHYDEDGKPSGSAGIKVARNAQINFRSESDKAIDCSECVKQLDVTDPIPSIASTKLHTTPKEAAEAAEAFLKDAHLSEQFSVAHIWLITNMDETNYAYRIECARMQNGIPCLWSENVWSDAMDSFSPEWYYERLEIYVSDRGIHRLSWSSPLQIGDTVTAETNLLPFAKIRAIMEKMLPILFEDEAKDYYGSEITYIRQKQIDRVELGLWRVRERDNIEQGLLVPAWAFYATTTADTAPDDAAKFDYHEEDYTLILLINAVDGTIIDATLGY